MHTSTLVDSTGKFSGQVKRLLIPNPSCLFFWLRLGSSLFVLFFPLWLGLAWLGFALLGFALLGALFNGGVWQGFIPFEPQPN